MNKAACLLLLCSITVLLFFPVAIRAQDASDWNPNFLLTDDDIFDSSAMDVTGIQTFLEREPGTLARYRAIDIDGQEKNAAQIIADAATRNRVNPKYLLALLQKEQSLIEDPSPIPTQYEWATGYGVCDSCDVKHPLVAQYRGFSVQIDRAAWRQGYYRDHSTEFRFQRGKTTPIEGTTVTPFNQATANLYNYTPYIVAQKRLLVIWDRYFIKKFPNGTLLQDPTSPAVWYLEAGQRRLIVSKAVLLSRFDPNHIVHVQTRDLLKYDIGDPIQFPNYSLLRAPNGATYLFANDVKRGFTSQKALRTLGYHPDEILKVSFDDLARYPDGEPLSEKSIFPGGALVQNTKTGAVFFVENGKRFPVIDRVFLAINFPGRKIIRMNPKELMALEESIPVTLPEGTIVRANNDATTYVVSGGKKRPFASLAAMKNLGYKEENMQIVPAKVLALHDNGDVIDFETRRVTPAPLVQTIPAQQPLAPASPPITNPLSLFYGS